MHSKIVSHARQRDRMRQNVGLLYVLTLTIEAIVFDASELPGLRYVSGRENTH